MEIRRFVSDLLYSNTYLLVEGNAAIVIDPARDTSPAEGLRIDRILLTHEHYDHISGVNAWKTATGAPVFCSEACAEGMADPRKNLARIFPAFCELQTWVKLASPPDADLKYTAAADGTFADTAAFEWKGHSFSLFSLPGHSPGGAGILVDGDSFFSGDSLMENGPVELRLPGGSRGDWERVSLPRLSALPEGITVYPGHFEPFVYYSKS